MESMLICWIEALNPSNETAPEESPVKKKHGDGDGEPGVNPSNTPSA
ncbi:MAG: hypothetical protein R8G66_21300 [Cytophagales bacterium]|nr:hypothetical protein [Cytophagales bacterium]